VEVAKESCSDYRGLLESIRANELCGELLSGFYTESRRYDFALRFLRLL
jgi:hypothetical protein